MTRSEKPFRTPRLRRLSDEEIEVWLAVAATVDRRPGAVLPGAVVPAILAKPSPQPATAPSSLQPRTYAAKPYVATPQAQTPARMAPLDRKVKQKLARGRLRADAAIDLHGLRQSEAHSALRHFLHGAQREGARLVLVVTGKGGRADDPFDMSGGGIGVLKRSVPHWLAQSDLRAIVVGFEEAGPSQGGGGALYVRLRRRER